VSYDNVQSAVVIVIEEGAATPERLDITRAEQARAYAPNFELINVRRVEHIPAHALDQQPLATENAPTTTDAHAASPSGRYARPDSAFDHRFAAVARRARPTGLPPAGRVLRRRPPGLRRHEVPRGQILFAEGERGRERLRGEPIQRRQRVGDMLTDQG